LSFYLKNNTVAVVHVLQFGMQFYLQVEVPLFKLYPVMHMEQPANVLAMHVLQLAMQDLIVNVPESL